VTWTGSGQVRRRAVRDNRVARVCESPTTPRVCSPRAAPVCPATRTAWAGAGALPAVRSRWRVHSEFPAVQDFTRLGEGTPPLSMPSC